MYLLIFSILVILAFLYAEERPSLSAWVGLVLFFIFFVGLRSPYIDNDYQNYLWASEKGWGIAEISYFWISDLSYALTGDYTLIFLIYAVVGVSGVFYALYKYSNNFWLSLAFYFCTYFVLLHMNAIRAGAAMGFAMLAWEPWSKNEHVRAILLLVLASIFHYSFTILLIAYPFIKNNDKFLLYYLLLVPLAYVFHFVVNLQALFALFNITFLTIKSNAYSKTIAGELSVFSTVLLLRIAVIFLLFYYRNYLTAVCDKFYLLFKLYVSGFYITIVLSVLPVVAIRALDIFACTELVLLPLFCEFIRPKWMAIAGICMYAAFYFFLYIIMAGYIKPYEINL